MKRYIKNILKNSLYSRRLKPLTSSRRFCSASYDFTNLKSEVISFVHSMQGKSFFEYRFSPSQKESDLYSSVYALITFGLLGEVENFSKKQKIQWSNYLLSHQDEDGLFRDKRLKSPLSETCHWWGWYHLAPHVLIALDYLKVSPKHDFLKVLELYKYRSMEDWLSSRNWEENYLAVSNEIMNVGVLLQYSRDRFANKMAAGLVEELKAWLLENERDQKTLLWGKRTDNSKFALARAVKAAYHIVPIYYYDSEEEKLNTQSLLHYALSTQHRLGGFGPCVLSDACEDIDSLYFLVTLTPEDAALRKKTSLAVKAFFDWAFVNMNSDGGFVFKRLTPFQYADQPRLSSEADQSNLFGTWFRTLSIALATDYLRIPGDFRFANVPGYQYYRVKE